MRLGSQYKTDRSAAIEVARDWVSMNFVVLDTETTGLGSLDRVVEISCIDRDGNVLLDSLVNPGIAIPVASTAIHGISDADVADKPSLFRLSGLYCGMRSVTPTVSWSTMPPTIAG